LPSFLFLRPSPSFVPPFLPGSFPPSRHVRSCCVLRVTCCTLLACCLLCVVCCGLCVVCCVACGVLFVACCLLRVARTWRSDMQSWSCVCVYCETVQAAKQILQFLASTATNTGRRMLMSTEFYLEHEVSSI
jgi:hypothetical protein